MQVPGSTTYSLALYYMMDTRMEDVPLLRSFVEGDDAYRNSRFKLIPYISKVNYICMFLLTYVLIIEHSGLFIFHALSMARMLNVGILDSEAECRQESMFGGSSS